MFFFVYSFALNVLYMTVIKIFDCNVYHRFILACNYDVNTMILYRMIYGWYDIAASRRKISMPFN